MKRLLKYACLLFALTALFFALTVGVSLIPPAAVEQNLASVAAHYRDSDMFELLDDSDVASVIHNYADAVLFNIIASQDAAHPVTSAMDARFYQDEDQTQGQNLYDAAENGGAANTSYARYWHGMQIFLKPLLCVTGIEGIRAVGAAVLLALALLYFVLLFRRRLFAAFGASLLGLALCEVWLVPLCIEYYACFALMFLFADIVLLRWEHLRDEGALFLLAGALTCFFDFLTCEILTLCVPLLLLLALRRDGWETGLRRTVRCCAAWLGGYAGTWLTKWLLASLVLGRSLTDVALGQGAYRAAGAVALDGVNIGLQPVAAITVNLYCMFPFRYLSGAPAIWLAFSLCLLALFCLWFLYRRDKAERRGAGLFFLLALVPFVRYAVISNHSALHPFFTYRDLFIFILAVAMGMAASIRLRRERPAPKKRRR